MVPLLGQGVHVPVGVLTSPKKLALHKQAAMEVDPATEADPVGQAVQAVFSAFMYMSTGHLHAHASTALSAEIAPVGHALHAPPAPK